MTKKKIILISIITLAIIIATPVIISLLIHINTPEGTIKFATEEKNKHITLKMTTNKNYKIYYTTDGSIPNKNSNRYLNEIEITKNKSPNILTNPINSKNIYGKTISYDQTLPKGVVIRAIAISTTGKKSQVYTKTFFPDIDLNAYFKGATIVSLVTDPENLLDYQDGIMVKGKIYDEWLKSNNLTIPKSEELVNSTFVEGNFMEHGKEWERECNIEIFNNSNSADINEQAGFRIKGNVSRMYNQKSLNIYFRDEYNTEYINYPLINNAIDVEGNKINKYKSFSLRNGGNDTELLKFKDKWLQSLIEDRAIDTQGSSISVLFINGEYWGVYDLQEKYSEDYYAEHYKLDKDNIIVIKEDEVEDGKDEDIEKYNELISFADKDLTIEENYNKFLELIDLQSMLDYYAIQTYINNIDWGYNDQQINKNVLLWRTRELENNQYGDTKWRWSLYDLEYSSSIYNIYETSANFCSISNAINKHPLFASAMKNEDFKTKFYETYFDIQKNNFNQEKIKETLNKEYALWEPLMADHYKRFGNNDIERIASKNSTLYYFEQKLYSNPC